MSEPHGRSVPRLQTGAVPRLQTGQILRVIEPSGSLLLRWQCRLEQEVRWHPEDVTVGSWSRTVIWPRPAFSNLRPDWHYTFTRRGAEWALNRVLRRRQREVARRSARTEHPVPATHQGVTLP